MGRFNNNEREQNRRWHWRRLRQGMWPRRVRGRPAWLFSRSLAYLVGWLARRRPLAVAICGDLGQALDPFLMFVEHGVRCGGGHVASRGAVLGFLCEQAQAIARQGFEQPGVVYVELFVGVIAFGQPCQAMRAGLSSVARSSSVISAWTGRPKVTN